MIYKSFKKQKHKDQFLNFLSFVQKNYLIMSFLIRKFKNIFFLQFEILFFKIIREFFLFTNFQIKLVLKGKKRFEKKLYYLQSVH